MIADGHDAARRRRYGHARLADGTPIDRSLRRVIGRAQLEGVVSVPISSPTGTQTLLDWLNEPAVGHAGAAGVTRYLELLHGDRPDIRREFPDLVADGTRLVAWARTSEDVPASLKPDAGPAVGPAGVNVVGYFRSEVGVGEAGRLALRALRAAEVSVTAVGERANVGVEVEPFEEDEASAEPYDVTLACVNADMLPGLYERAGELFESRHAIGLWFWEVERFPDRFHGAFELVDEVWAASRHIANALRPVSPVPVYEVMLPVVPPEPADGIGRAELGLPDGTLFLFAWDYRSVMARKNPLGTLAAFTAAFPEPGAASLVLKCINSDAAPDHHRALLRAAAERPDVHVVDRYLSARERDALLHACDAYVSLHRAEGLGLVLAEAMALGKPVVATGYSGNADFMTADNSYPVPYKLVPIGPGADPYPAAARWAEPDIEAAARALREIQGRPDVARERGRRAASDIRNLRSPSIAGARMAQRLRAVRDRRTRRRPPGTDVAREVPPIAQISVVRDRLERGPTDGSGGALGRVGKVARPGLLRALLPYTAYQREIDEGLIEALTGVEQRLHGITEAVFRHDSAVERLTRTEGDLRRLIATVEARLRAVVRPTEARVDDLAGRLNELADKLGVASDGPVGEPWSHAYNAAHREFVTRVLEDPDTLARMRRRQELPAGYGVGLDERVVEFPWLFTRDLAGTVLDAGSTLNHAHVLPRIVPRVDDLHIVTLAPEAEAHPDLGVSYVFADLRDLPLRDDTYDVVVSISTLEHVGMDTSHFGGTTTRAADPEAETERAVAELRRVLKPSGVIYLTVPFGRRDDFGWLRVFDADALDGLVAAFAPSSVTTAFFRYDERGWQRSTAQDTSDVRYRDHFSEPEPGADRAVAARGVACLELRI